MNNNFNIKIKLLNKNAKLPSKSHSDDIGYDLYSDGEYTINPGEVVRVKLGISLQLPTNVGGFVLPRSGLASKYLISPINSPGLIDPGYRGELMVPLMNYSKETYKVSKHERIAQLVAITTNNLIFEEVENLDDSERSDGGFGSTGKN
ncbi:MAG: dUTP diphosphatase [Actinobacteria bacterium]|nr:dUTP diphosphatase [Actinomycetota bacterium]